MKGIWLSHGVVFAKDDLYTVRLLPTGECGPAPVTYETLEWELRTEPLDQWNYLTEDDLRALPDGGFDRIMTVLDELHRVMGD